MAEKLPRMLARENARLKRQARSATAAPRLQNASLDDTDLPYVDREGVIKASWGKQPDGSVGGRVIKSDPQPAPSAPVLPVPSAEEPVSTVFLVGWDGAVIEGSVPLVHGHIEVWGQFLNGGAPDLNVAKLMGTIRDRAGGGTTVTVGRRQGQWVFWLRMVGQDRITKSEFSGPSTVEVTQRVDAGDIDDRLNAFADGELGDAAYENLLVRLGEFMNIRADQIDVNSLAADEAFIGELETAGIILRNEGQGRRTEVSGDGVQVFDTTTETPLIQIGNFTGGDLISLYHPETREPTVSLNGAGGVSAVHLSSQADPDFGGKPFAGELALSPMWAAAASTLETVGQGAPRILVRGFTGASGPSPRGIAFIEAKLTPGRSYAIKVTDFQMGNSAAYYMTAYYTTSADPDVRPATPTSSSAMLGTSTGNVPPGGVGWATTTLSYEKVYTSPTARWIRIFFVVGRYDSGAVTFGSSNTIATNPRMYIEDLGPRVGDGGRSTWRDPSSSAPSAEAPDLVSLPYPVFRTATYTLNTSTGVATRVGINVEPRFGYWPNGIYYVTLVQFASWSQGGAYQSVDLNVTPARWATAAGQVVQSGLVAMTGDTPASFNFNAEREPLEALTGVGAGSTRNLPIDSMQAEAQAGRFRGSVLIGATGWAGSAQNNSAAGVLHVGKTFARLHTTTAVQDGDATSDG